MDTAAQDIIQSRPWVARFDEGRHWRARIGFVLIATEHNVEHLDAQLEDMAAAARLILPGEHPDVVCYACTSGSVVRGRIALSPR